MDCTIASAFIPHEKKQRGTQTGYDQNKGNGNDNFHLGASYQCA